MHSAFLPYRNSSTVRVAKAVIAPESVPESKWPVWATAIAYFKSDRDLGVGDTVERVIGKANSMAFKAWYLVTFKKSCGCNQRKSEWNVKYKYSTG